MRLATLEEWLPLRGRWLGYLFHGLAWSVAAVGPAVLFQLARPCFGGGGKPGPVAAAKAQVSAFGTALELYTLDNDQAPTTQQGLAALITPPTAPPLARKWAGPYLKDVTQIPLDPWGHPYRYRAVRGDSDPFIVVSFGEDGRAGGTGYAADIGSKPTSTSTAN